MEALAGRPIVHNSTRFSSTPRVANIPRYALHVHNALRRNQALSDPHLCPKPQIFVRTAVNNEKPEQVAESLGITRNAVDQAKNRMIEKLRDIVSKLEAVDAGVG